MNKSVSKSDQIVSLRLSAPVSDRENARLSRLLGIKIAEAGKLRLLVFLQDYPARDSAESLFEDIRFIKLHADNIEKMAVVGERAWQETWIALFGLFGRVETAYFDYTDKEKAKRWIRH